MTYPTISELEKRIEQLENHNQFLAKRLDAHSSRIAVLEGHPKNFEKTVEG